MSSDTTLRWMYHLQSLQPVTRTSTMNFSANLINLSNTHFPRQVHIKILYVRVQKDQTFAIKTLLLILQHFKHCRPRSSPLYWRYTVPNISSIVGMLPGMHFL